MSAALLPSSAVAALAFDCVSLVVLLWALYAVWIRGEAKLGYDGRLLTALFVFILIVRDFSNIAQYVYSDEWIESYEDLFEILAPMLFTFFLYGLTQHSAKQGIRAREERQTAILNTLDAGVLVIDAATHVIASVNTAAARMIGLPSESIVGNKCHRFICANHEGHCPITDRSTSVVDEACSLVTHDGITIPILKNGALATLDGRTQIVESFVDIRPRLQAEENLRRWEHIFRNAAWGVAVVNTDAVTVELTNPAFAAMYGYRVAELVNASLQDLFADSSRLRLQEHLEAARVMGSRVLEAQGRRRNGDAFPVLVSVTAIRSSVGKPACYVLNVQDISERKRAEEALRVSEERFRTTFELAAVGLAHVAPDGRWLRVNKTLCDITGYARDELLALTVRDVTHPEDRDVDRAQIAAVLEGNLATYSVEKRCVHKNGASVWVHLTAALAHTAAGEPDYFIGAVEDITARKRAEETRNRLEEELRQAQKMEAVGQLAGGVGHDFNNILHAILAHAELAMMTLDDTHESYAEVLGIKEAADRAASLVRQLLAFSRRQILNLEVLDLNELIDGFLKMIRRVIGEDIELEFLSARGLGKITADQVQIEQILMNLCVNARDAMPEGGKITIETRDVAIDDEYCLAHRWARPGRFVCLSVLDTGTGMSPETLEQIFNPFFTTKEVGRGTGLGLATVYGVVAQHEGLIDVTSAVGKGSRFRIFIPRAAEAAHICEEAAHYQPAGGAETILVAEDDDMVRELMVRVLRQAGYSVLTATNGEEAVQRFEADGFAIRLALLDAVMPKMGGREAYDRIKTIAPHVRVLFCSGYNPDSVHSRFVLEPGMQLIQKPCQPSVLLRKVREALDADKASAQQPD